MFVTDYGNKELPVIWVSVEEILRSWVSVDTNCMKERDDFKAARSRRSLIKVLAAKRNDRKYESIKDNIRRHGFNQPLCCHKSRKRQMDGHHRLAAAIDLGYKYIPYIDGKGYVFLNGLGTWKSPIDERLLHPENPDFSNSNKELEYAQEHKMNILELCNVMSLFGYFLVDAMFYDRNGNSMTVWEAERFIVPFVG